LAGCGAVGWLSVVRVWAGPGSGGAAAVSTRETQRAGRPSSCRTVLGTSACELHLESILAAIGPESGKTPGRPTRSAADLDDLVEYTLREQRGSSLSAPTTTSRMLGPDTRPISRRSASIRRRLRDMAGAETMDFVLECAVRRARPGGVLLSSAAASMGMSATDGARGPAFEIAGRRWVGDRGGR